VSETPILDLEREPPKARRPWAAYLFSAVAVIIIARWIPVDSLWWFPVLYVSIAFHEIGHLVAGKLAGMKAGGIVVGGLMLLRSGDRWRFHFDYRRLLSGGLAKSLPTRGDFNRARYAWMVAGGPLATILLATVSGIALWRSGSGAGWLSSLWWINLILFGGTLLPAAGPNKSDGARLWMLLRSEEETRSWIALHHVMAEEAVGVLPRAWDAELFALMLRPDTGGDTASRHMLAFYRYNDQRDECRALQHLEKALSASGTCGKAVRRWCFAEAACSSALLRGNPVAARTWVARAAKLRKAASKHNVEAYLAQSEGRYADAQKAWDATLAFLARKKMDSGLARYAKARIEEYRDWCRAELEKSAHSTVTLEPRAAQA
jgi:Peptidase family M50